MVFDRFLPLLKPDVVVVSFNFNDRRYVLDAAEIDNAERFERLYESSHSGTRKLSDPFDIFYSYCDLRRVFSRVGLVPTRTGEFQVDQLSPRGDEEGYRRNPSHIAQETRRLGVPLLFVLLRDNPLESAHLKKGLESLRAADYETAIAHLGVAVWSDAMFSDLGRIYIAQAFKAKGETAHAAAAVVSRSPLRSLQGGRPVRLDIAYNDIMRQVAR